MGKSAEDVFDRHITGVMERKESITDIEFVDGDLASPHACLHSYLGSKRIESHHSSDDRECDVPTGSKESDSIQRQNFGTFGFFYPNHGPIAR
jgi:hypothetical protein